MAIGKVTGVVWWGVTVSHYKALYRRHRSSSGDVPGQSSGYTKDFLQAPRVVRQTLDEMFPRTLQTGLDLQYVWPGGRFPGGHIYKATDERYEVGQWTQSEAPLPWKIGDPTSDPVITIPGDTSLRIPDQADDQWRNQIEPLGPWLVMVQVENSQTELHIRAYLEDPPSSRPHTALSNVPQVLRDLMTATAPGGAVGTDLPELWFDDARLHDAFLTAPPTPSAMPSGASAGAPYGTSAPTGSTAATAVDAEESRGDADGAPLVNETSAPGADDGAVAEEFVESRRRMKERQYFARHPGVKAAAVADRGTRCEACQIDFGEVYGELGWGYIECHHLEQLADRFDESDTEPVTTTVDDVALLCANCHRMVHRRRPPVPVGDLRELIDQQRGRAT